MFTMGESVEIVWKVVQKDLSKKRQQQNIDEINKVKQISEWKLLKLHPKVIKTNG